MTNTPSLRCVMAQLNLVVGDVDGNTSRIVAAANEARDRWRADVVMLPELAVSGYPPEDLLFHAGMRLQVARSIERLKAEVRGITFDRGLSRVRWGADLQFRDRRCATARSSPIIARPACRTTGYSTRSATSHPAPIRPWSILHGFRAGVLVCEDIWEAEPARRARGGRRRGAAGHQCLALRGRQADAARAARRPAARRARSGCRSCSSI